MRILQPLSLLLLTGTLIACSVSRRLERRSARARVSHTTEQQRIDRAAQDTNTFKQDYLKFTRLDGTDNFFVPAVITPSGERMMSLQVQEVVVTARARSLPERMGRVNIDFVVTLPRELQGKCRCVSVTPVLHKDGADQPLQKVTIRGALFSEVQDRSYWAYDKFLRVAHPDSLRARRIFDRLVRHPYAEGVRLDSVVERRDNISYYYRQQVRTSESGNKLRVTLEGIVEALDGSRYSLPVGDTLEYSIFSLISMADTTTRYVDKIIKRHETVEDRNYIAYRINESQIVDSLGDNARQLARIRELMDRMLNLDEYYVDTVTLTASASPEGSYRHNERLARERAYSLREYLASRFELPDTMLTVRWVSEDWPELGRLIRVDDSLKNGPDILTMIDHVTDRDRLEQQIARMYPDDYRHIRERLYPRLRAVTFRYSLRRIGMTVDTIRTTVPDTAYLRGVDLLRNRHYGASLSVLDGYRDRNTAICLLSLGYDDRALEVLSALPQSPQRDYLLAIACARLGLKTEALDYFRRAVEQDGRMRFRGRMDPAISELLKTDDNEG